MEQKKSRAAEVIRFALTGGVCFLVELAVLVLLKGRFGVDTLIATPIAFLISVILNYLLCVIWVFRGAKNKGVGAKAGFLVTSLIGLGLNELLMLVFRLTLELAVPPLSRMKASASWREKVGSVPVTTRVIPANAPPLAPSSAWGETPASRSLWIMV